MRGLILHNLGVRVGRRSLALLACFVAVLLNSQIAAAHFSYSDPRIVHVAEADGQVVILARMPAPLALLPEDWKGAADTRLPPFGAQAGDKAILDSEAVASQENELKALLNDAVLLWSGGQRVETGITAFRFWSDEHRPRFGTLKTALAAFDARSDAAKLDQTSYFDLTVDLLIAAPSAQLSETVRLESQLGHRFKVMERLGTVVKLHRPEGIETRAGIGLLNVSFARVSTFWDKVIAAALSGAEHIYLGLDHLAIILLIAIAAANFRQALFWASAFTVGHMITLYAGLYGFVLATSWFVPTIELAIVLSIVAVGFAIFLRKRTPIGGFGMLAVGLIHGYGFAAAASEALFAGAIDPLVLVAFAVGLELCQFAIYAFALPLIWAIDRILTSPANQWRRATALGISIFALSVAFSRFSDATAAFGVT